MQVFREIKLVRYTEHKCSSVYLYFSPMIAEDHIRQVFAKINNKFAGKFIYNEQTNVIYYKDLNNIENFLEFLKPHLVGFDQQYLEEIIADVKKLAQQESGLSSSMVTQQRELIKMVAGDFIESFNENFTAAKIPTKMLRTILFFPIVDEKHVLGINIIDQLNSFPFFNTLPEKTRQEIIQARIDPHKKLVEGFVMQFFNNSLGDHEITAEKKTELQDCYQKLWMMFSGRHNFEANLHGYGGTLPTLVAQRKYIIELFFSQWFAAEGKESEKHNLLYYAFDLLFMCGDTNSYIHVKGRTACDLVFTSGAEFVAASIDKVLIEYGLTRADLFLLMQEAIRLAHITTADIQALPHHWQELLLPRNYVHKEEYSDVINTYVDAKLGAFKEFVTTSEFTREQMGELLDIIVSLEEEGKNLEYIAYLIHFGAIPSYAAINDSVLRKDFALFKLLISSGNHQLRAIDQKLGSTWYLTYALFLQDKKDEVVINMLQLLLSHGYGICRDMREIPRKLLADRVTMGSIVSTGEGVYASIDSTNIIPEKVGCIETMEQFLSRIKIQDFHLFIPHFAKGLERLNTQTIIHISKRRDEEATDLNMQLLQTNLEVLPTYIDILKNQIKAKAEEFSVAINLAQKSYRNDDYKKATEHYYVALKTMFSYCQTIGMTDDNRKQLAQVHQNIASCLLKLDQPQVAKVHFAWAEYAYSCVGEKEKVVACHEKIIEINTPPVASSASPSGTFAKTECKVVGAITSKQADQLIAMAPELAIQKFMDPSGFADTTKSFSPECKSLLNYYLYLGNFKLNPMFKAEPVAEEDLSVGLVDSLPVDNVYVTACQ